MKQQELRLEGKRWGGRREGAGRRRRPGASTVPHRTRAALASRFPVHVTWRLQAGLPNLRDKRSLKTIEGALARGCERPGFRLVHYSVQRDHLHLLIEARDAPALSRWLQGLGIRLA